MGTTAHYDTTVAELKAKIINSFNFRNKWMDSSILAHNDTWALQCVCNLGNGVFEVIPVWLNVYRSSRAPVTYEKVLDATVHPYRYDCPMSYIKLAMKYPPSCDTYFNDWCKKVIEYHEYKKERKALVVEVGKNYHLKDGREITIVRERNKTSWLICMGSGLYKLAKHRVCA